MIISEKKQDAIGLVLWRGKSLLDNNPIAVIATGIFGKSENRKTGELVQTYILRTDISPELARRLGKDKSICGDCKHKENNTCYVNLCHGPIPVFNAFHNNKYREFVSGDEQLFTDKKVRFGAYGDPAAVPVEVWEEISKISAGFVGYTHQWNNKKCDQRLKHFCMASVDSIRGYDKEYENAKKLGWRTFRVYGTLKQEDFKSVLKSGEIICPASKEGGLLTNCKKCLICSGTSKPKVKDIMIPFHGDSPSNNSNWKLKNYIKMMIAIKNKKQWRKNFNIIIKNFKELCKF